ncbi:DUF2590 family protein [Pasteurellaceae bacterium HPA106]|uniref:DUF2590 family protein n=1 Tax=Spirabiliibacterium pneumoniae TaxID=221400 RepID=UPI001AACD5A4|nr:DUF2590 family protein [Spirabiliibacterium pneumoniae]MBE2895566.1 DUF2590 family protein [Spirabiliibacterium pneumoniae]
MEDKYFDILITDEDVTLDSGGVPQICNNRVSIAQDIKHAILESGLATQLIAQRSSVLRRDVYLQIIFLVEEDERLIPGTIFLTEESPERLLLTAETYDFGKISVYVSVNDE